MTYMDDAAAEIREMLDANARNDRLAAEQGEPRHGPVRTRIRAERLQIIDRLTALAAAEAARRPPGDGDLPGEEEDDG